jgi:hypothetical protein
MAIKTSIIGPEGFGSKMLVCNYGGWTGEQKAIPEN